VADLPEKMAGLERNRCPISPKYATCASVLHEMPQEGGNQEPATDYYEEQETSDARCMPQLWNQGF